MMKPQEIAERALELAAGDDLAVAVTQDSQVNLRWAANSLTTNGDIVGRNVNIVCFHTGVTGVGCATASGQVDDPDALAELVAQGRAAAREASPAEGAFPLPAGSVSPDWKAETARTDPGELRALAGGLGEAFRRGSAEGVEHFGYAEHDITTTFLATTAGALLRHEQHQGRAEFTAKSHDRSRSTWSGRADRSLSSLDIAVIDDELRAALSLQGTRAEVVPGRHPVILTPSAAADLMVDLYWAADARSAIDGRSAFAAAAGGTRLGEDLGGGVTLVSDPAGPDPGMACAPFEVSVAPSATSSPFDNGLPLSATRWIDDGILRHLVTTRHTADLIDSAATPGIDNLTLTTPDGAGSLGDVIARTEFAVLVTCLWYNRMVDPQTLLITGLTRDGVYLVRDGAIVGTSGNFRFNESPLSLLGRIVDSGDSVRTLAREMGDYFNRATMPPLLVADFNLSTPSEAL